MTTGNPIFRGCPSNNQSGTCAKLEVYNWLSDVPNTANPEELVEIRFKNTRKDYYKNVNGLKLEVGDLVAVEASPGHDIGMVSLVGDLVLKQMRRHKVTMLNGEMRKIYRKAKPVDIEKWEQAMQREHETMIRSRQITNDLKLNMKIGDVEFQGDGTKAIFYYIADERVDFRTLIKVLAETFRIRIEMKQIGARQEAGRIGGIGPCGRELCCCAWMSNFSSVTTTAARYQDISLNPQKLAGQCSKLKCCLNYEVDAYIDEQRDFPSINIKLETEEGTYNYLKSDIFKRIFWYTLEGPAPTGMIGVPVERVKDVIAMNRRGERPAQLILPEGEPMSPASQRASQFDDILGQDSLTRFDKPKGEKGKRRKPNNNRNKTPRPINEQDAAPQNTEQTGDAAVRVKPQLKLNKDKANANASNNKDQQPVNDNKEPQNRESQNRERQRPEIRIQRNPQNQQRAPRENENEENAQPREGENRKNRQNRPPRKDSRPNNHNGNRDMKPRLNINKAADGGAQEPKPNRSSEAPTNNNEHQAE